MTLEVCHQFNHFFFKKRKKIVCTRSIKLESMDIDIVITITITVVEHFECHTSIEVGKIGKAHSRTTKINYQSKVKTIFWKIVNFFWFCGLKIIVAVLFFYWAYFEVVFIKWSCYNDRFLNTTFHCEIVSILFVCLCFFLPFSVDIQKTVY